MQISHVERAGSFAKVHAVQDQTPCGSGAMVEEEDKGARLMEELEVGRENRLRRSETLTEFVMGGPKREIGGLGGWMC